LEALAELSVCFVRVYEESVTSTSRPLFKPSPFWARKNLPAGGRLKSAAEESGLAVDFLLVAFADTGIQGTELPGPDVSFDRPDLSHVL
jgi:hypothetical protein